MSKKIFSFDAESNGLWGKAFAIAAVVYSNGVEISKFVGRCTIEGDVDEWVKNNVLPKIEEIPVNYKNYKELIAGFADFYMKNKKDADILVHVGFPVEVKILLDMHDFGFIGDWDAPYPLYDLSLYLAQAGENPISAKDYATKYGLSFLKEREHNPLYDAQLTARIFIHLQSRNPGFLSK